MRLILIHDYSSMKLLKKVLEVALPILFAVAIMGWIYRHTDWQEVAHLMASLHWGWMAISMIPGVLAQVFRGWRWRLTLTPLGEHARRSSCVYAIFVSYAASLVVPRIGEVTRCGILRKTDGVTFSKAIGTVITERMVDTLLLLVLCIATFAVQIPTLRTFMSQTGTSLTTHLHRFTSTGYLVTILSLMAVMVLGVILAVRLRFFSRIQGILRNLWEGITSLRHTQYPIRYVAYSIGIWAAYYLHFYLAFFSFNATAHITPMQALVMFCVGTFAVLVPTPNGAGPWHFAIKTMLVLYGLTNPPAALIVLVIHTLQTALVAFLGGLGWLRLNMRTPQNRL
ncbi:MAG: lysylphosphatidylglycerol synthase transmembrane domain-containing protein [Bacteroidales bacterium]|nr:lysylphosphatidylglycerol synthase transmembrane domain-containing protein [Bacteroidales bacterium]